MENPYEPIEASSHQSGVPIYPLVSVRAVLFLLAMTFAGAIVGGGLGYLTGIVAPSYYDAVLGVKYNHAKVGFGLGVGQGAAVGTIAGLGLIGITYLFKYRRQFPNERSAEEKISS